MLDSYSKSEVKRRVYAIHGTILSQRDDIVHRIRQSNRLQAEEQQKQEQKHSRYILKDLGTFGGPSSFFFNVPIVASVNNSGTVVGGADTGYSRSSRPKLHEPGLPPPARVSMAERRPHGSGDAAWRIQQ